MQRKLARKFLEDLAEFYDYIIYPASGLRPSALELRPPAPGPRRNFYRPGFGLPGYSSGFPVTDVAAFSLLFSVNPTRLCFPVLYKF